MSLDKPSHEIIVQGIPFYCEAQQALHPCCRGAIGACGPAPKPRKR